ncbi:MAG: uL15m family ribosomal protein, partial [Thermoplasmatota archaeon]
GFTRHGQKKEKTTINVGDLWQFDTDEIDLASQGYDKLLGGGRVEAAFTVTVSEATERAIEKIEAAGGTVTSE